MISRNGPTLGLNCPRCVGARSHADTEGVPDVALGHRTAGVADDGGFCLAGYGTDEAEKWPKESSYLIFTDDESAMHNLAARFGQNALLKIAYKKQTQLLLLEPMGYIQS